MSLPASSLPERWIQSLWTELRANYGGRWDRMFPVPPCPPDVAPDAHAQAHIQAIQAVWAKRLGRFQFNSSAIRHALDHLPTEPPNLPEFEVLCNRRPDAPQQPALNRPKADPERVAREIAKIRENFKVGDNLGWARALHEADIRGGTFNGKYITLAQRQTYRLALGL